MSDNWTATQVNEDWTKARRRAFWGSVVDVLRRRPSTLLPLEEVKLRLNIQSSMYRGLQQVPLDQIVGSEGRYADFDRRFLPKQEQIKARWQSIDTARIRDTPLPPVDLYKIGEMYFVKDGNHRVSVARQLGQIDIDAFVTEYHVEVPLASTLSMRDLLIKEEYSDFLEWTRLARLRPQQRIELSALGGYLEMIQHINTHRYYLALERGTDLSPDEAVMSWYDQVYVPVIEAIRRGNILDYFPGRSEADLYLWIMSHRNALREFSGVDPGPEAAALDYASQYGKRGVLATVSDAVQRLREAAANVVETITPPPLELLDFVEWSHIDRICPDADVRLSDQRDYVRLRQHILDHRFFWSNDLGSSVSLDAAIEHWCASLYSPIVEALRATGALQLFPGHTEMDLFLWITDHMYFRKLEGVALEPAAAVREFMARYGDDPNDHEGALAALLQRARRLVRRR